MLKEERSVYLIFEEVQREGEIVEEDGEKEKEGEGKRKPRRRRRMRKRRRQKKKGATDYPEHRIHDSQNSHIKSFYR